MFFQRLIATIMTACVAITGAPGGTISGIGESVVMAEERNVASYDTTGGIGGVIVPVYENDRLVANYLIDPLDARVGLQQIFDWAEFHHTQEGSTGQIRVEIPRGTYTIHKVTKAEQKSYKKTRSPFRREPVSYLALYGKTTLDMRSGATLVLDKDQRDDCLMRFGRIDEPASGYDTFTDVKILGGTLDGANTSHPLLRFAHASHVVVRGVRFTNLFMQHHFEFAGCDDVRVDGCTFDRYRSNDFGSGNNHEALQLDVLTESAFPGAGSGGYDGTTNRNILVENCTFKHCKRGIGTHTGIVGLYQTNITIKNNTMTNVIGYGIASINWSHATIEGNDISGSRGIYFKHLSGPNHRKYMPNKFNNKTRIQTDSKSVIRNNKITIKSTEEARYHFGIATFGEKIDKPFKAMNSKGETRFINKGGHYSPIGTIPAGDYRVKKLVIKDNTIINTTKAYGVLLKGAVSSKVSGNSITNTSPAGFKKGAAIWDDMGRANRITANTISDEGGAFAADIVISQSPKDKVLENSITDRTVLAGRVTATPVNLRITAGSGNAPQTGGSILESRVTDENFASDKSFGLVVDRSKGIVVSKNRTRGGTKQKMGPFDAKLD